MIESEYLKENIKYVTKLKNMPSLANRLRITSEELIRAKEEIEKLKGENKS